MRHTRIDPAEGRSDERPAWPEGACVRERMSAPAVIVTAGTTVAEALRLMADHRIHYLPVVDEAAAIVGIVNADDLLGTRRPRPAHAETVAGVMSAPAVTVGPAEPMESAMRLMADRGVGALPIVEQGRVVGILTQSDVVAAVARPEAR
jgi:CBS-domain-containing membrane protein